MDSDSKKIGSQTSRLVEPRLIYASTMGIDEAIADVKEGDALHKALMDKEDIDLIAISITADKATCGSTQNHFPRP